MNSQIYYKAKHKVPKFSLIFFLLPVLYFGFYVVSDFSLLLTTEHGILDYSTSFLFIGFLIFFLYRLVSYYRHNRNVSTDGEYIVITDRKIEFHNNTIMVKEIYDYQIDQILINSVHTVITIVEADTNQKILIKNIYNKPLQEIYDNMIGKLNAY